MKTNFFSVSINTCRDGQIFYACGKKNSRKRYFYFPMKITIFLRKSFFFPFSKCYKDTNLNKLDLHLRLLIIHA